MVQPRQTASAQTAVRTSSSARMSRSQRNAVLQRATSSHSRIGLKRWRLCYTGYVLHLFRIASHPPIRRIPSSVLQHYHVASTHPFASSRLRFRSSIPGQTLRMNSAHLSNVTSGLRIPPPFPHGQRRQMLPPPSQMIPSAPFPSLLSLALDLKSQNPSTLMKKRADPLRILQFPRTCPVSPSQTSRDGTTAAPPCSL
jgi:hypothetical protein